MVCYARMVQALIGMTRSWAFKVPCNLETVYWSSARLCDVQESLMNDMPANPDYCLLARMLKDHYVMLFLQDNMIVVQDMCSGRQMMKLDPSMPCCLADLVQSRILLITRTSWVKEKGCPILLRHALDASRPLVFKHADHCDVEDTYSSPGMIDLHRVWGVPLPFEECSVIITRRCGWTFTVTKPKGDYMLHPVLAMCSVVIVIHIDNKDREGQEHQEEDDRFMSFLDSIEPIIGSGGLVQEAHL